MIAGVLKPWIERKVARWRDGIETQEDDAIARETPVLMAYNGESHAVMLATPQDLEDFATGFSLSEEIVRDAGEIQAMKIHDHPEGLAILMTIPKERLVAQQGRQRAMTGRTGCGLCGVRTLEQAVRYPAPVGTGVTIAPDILHKALASLLKAQEINLKTGSTHAAAWVSLGGAIDAVREDVGRHNALDKLIGHLARTGVGPDDGFALITSRASYEMVQKAAAFGISLLAAVSAPTSLAVRMADKAGLTLIGFARPRAHVTYTHPQRLREEGKTV